MTTLGKHWKVPLRKPVPKLKGDKSHRWKGGKPECIKCGKQLRNYGTKMCGSCSHTAYYDKIGRKEHPRYYHRVDKKKYEDWRLSVFIRDGWMCQNCKKIGIYLEAHHIKSWAHYPQHRYDIENGLTLCRECHKLTDNYKGKGIKK